MVMGGVVQQMLIYKTGGLLRLATLLTIELEISGIG